MILRPFGTSGALVLRREMTEVCEDSANAPVQSSERWRPFQEYFCKVDRYEVSCDADDRYSDAQQLAHSIVLRLLSFTSGSY
jgi:hypothetical protein